MQKKVMNFSGVPTFRFFKEGELINEMSGANLKKIKANIDALLGKSPEIKNVEEILKDSIYCVSEYSHYEILHKVGLAVVYFTKSNYEPCIKIESLIQELSKEHANIKFIKLDVEEVDDEIIKNVKGPRQLPTIRFLRDGVTVKETRGNEKDSVKKNIQILLGNLSEILEIKSVEDLLKDSIYNVSEYVHYEKLISAGLVVIDFTAGNYLYNFFI